MENTGKKVSAWKGQQGRSGLYRIRYGEPFTVPAVIFDRLPEDHVVQMFVTINAKHTRLNSSHLVSLSGRYRKRYW